MKRIAIALALAGASCAALALLPSRADADDFKSRGCGWPLLLSSEGPANVQGPDDAAYEVVHKGAGYDFEVGEPLPDAKIVPYRGANPFVRPGGNPGSYTVESRAAISSGVGSRIVPNAVVPNTIRVTADLVWIVACPRPPAYRSRAGRGAGPGPSSRTTC
jgi:hypothetical protein